jgi:predicted HTH domain antitoxin
MQGIMIEIPKEIVLSLRIPKEKAKERLKEELAIHLYKEGFLSFGKARALAALSKWEFAERLGIKKISRHYTREDFEDDLIFANG